MKRRAWFMWIMITAWGLLITTYIVLVFVYRREMSTEVACFEFVLYSLLALQLLVINCILLRQLKTLFESNEAEKFKKERHFLLTTLIFFSLGYLMMDLRNVLIFKLLSIRTPETGIEKYLCDSNLRMSAFNILIACLSDLLPYMIIFSLNFNNFRDLERRRHS